MNDLTNFNWINFDVKLGHSFKRENFAEQSCEIYLIQLHLQTSYVLSSHPIVTKLNESLYKRIDHFPRDLFYLFHTILESYMNKIWKLGFFDMVHNLLAAYWQHQFLLLCPHDLLGQYCFEHLPICKLEIKNNAIKIQYRIFNSTK